jgi:hypothetical protein
LTIFLAWPRTGVKPVCRILCVVAAAALPAHGATLQATAGLGGVAKSGRWTPLTVSIGSERDALEGDLVVSWGDTELRRAITIGAATRKDVELYVRTSDPGATIDVRLVSGGREVARTSAPVRILGADDRAVVCVLSDAAASPGSADCTTTVLTRALPRSARGYEVADDVVWPAVRTGVTAEQDAAIRAWRALEALDASGDLGATPQVSRPVVPRGLPTALMSAVALIGAAYLAAFAAAGWMLRLRRAPLIWTGTALVAITAAGCAAVAGVGRVGATRAVHLHHVSLLQQLPNAQTSVLTVRAIAEFPAFDRFTLRLPAADATLETTRPRGGASAVLDADGYPLVAGVFGAAARQAFAGEALVRERPLSIEEHGGRVSIRNQSDRTLYDCRLGRGFSTSTPVAALAPGARIDASWTGINDEAPSGPAVTCRLDEAPLPLTEPNHPVVMHGSTTIAAYRSVAAAGGAGD